MSSSFDGDHPKNIFSISEKYLIRLQIEKHSHVNLLNTCFNLSGPRHEKFSRRLR